MSELVDMVHWMLVCIGIVYFITESSIFAFFRIAITKGSQFRIGLFYCPACTGFWVGALYGFARGTTFGPPLSLDATLLTGIAVMALGAAWTSARGGNLAYEIEAPLRGEGVLHDEAKESEDGR